MTKINYKSDFDFIAEVEAIGADDNKVAIGFPQYDWEIILTTGDCSYNSRTYVVSYRKGVAINCYNDNGKIRIICDNHKLPVGQLKMEFRSFLPNSNYPDGTQKVVATYDLDIELTTENTGITSAEVQIVLPFLYDSAYNQAVKGGYQGSQEEYFALASQLPDAVETANKVQTSADSLADSAEAIGGAIETLGATTDAIEQGANVIKDNANTLQESANIVKTSAEHIGGNIKELQESINAIDVVHGGLESATITLTQGAIKVETSATTLDGVSATISGSATAIAEGANTIKNSADALQENADKVSESATKVEQAVEPLVQASESLDATKQAFELLSSEWSDGRQAIATALTNRRYPTEPSESFHAMADKITNMSYEEGWFAKIGYTDENASALKEMIDYSYELAKGWNPDGSTPSLFEGNKNILFYPIVDTSQIPTAGRMFYGTTLLFIPNLSLPKAIATDSMFTYSNVVKVGDIDIPNATNTQSMFAQAPNLTHIGAINSPKATIMNYTFNITNIKYVKSVDVGSATQIGAFISTGILFICMKNLGKSTLTTYNFSAATSWGTDGEENRQSLIDSLIAYSYDRASNGMSTATIKLSANTKALLTEEEIAQITNKGFTIA